MYKIFDQERYTNAQDVKKVQMSYSGVDYLSDLTPAGLKKYRKYFQWAEYYNQIASIPIYNPLVFVRDSIYIFDFYKNKLVVFNETGRYNRECKINFHNEIKLEEICLDTYKKKVYAVSSDNGLFSLNIINLNTGKINNTFKIENHLYPQKIKIRNNFVYFLDKMYNRKKELYKFHIKS